ncbi:DUF7927 domain-containing protein [Microbacterium sp. XT11]|uniref:DUF7927 domain-containing protein n=1 Tax=Microbacterium sp. XT11 TaxID=367477 RepID=UPI0007430BF4|nr:DUF11 domain-containing protein [Microbacterium sp. XT11]ALX65989.1 hypothetical protein AB663_000825 [Microbacterium sp. XT11]
MATSTRALIGRRRPAARPGRSGERRRAGVAAAIVAALAVSLLGVALPSPALAAGNTPPSNAYSNQWLYAYVEAGETVVGTGNIEQVVAPDGTTALGPGTYGPAAADGVWRIHLPSQGTSIGYSWTVDVHAAGSGQVIPGRVWSDRYYMQQASGTANTVDLNFWIVNNTGYVYAVELDDYNGVNSIFEANSVGWADEADCIPPYASYEPPGGVGTTLPLPDCGETYRVFFEEPADDLPQVSSTNLGSVNVRPDLLGPADLAVDDLAFAPAGGGSATGTFTYSINDRFTGGYVLQIDVDGDGSYDGQRDRSIRLGADGSGSYSYAFDGLDGLGDPIEDCTRMGARVFFDKLGEVHILQTDVEGRAGISIRRLNGAGAPDSTIYWDDTQMTGARVNTTPVLSATDGADSAGGAHGWAYDNNSWGNERVIDDWTYLPADFGTGEIQFGGRCLSIDKTSDFTEDSRPGDVVAYTVTATNVGDTDYTVADPAVLFDDLSGVLDDATYNDDAAVVASDGDDVPAPAFIEPSHLSWAGPLAAGESVELTYTVTLGSAGDGEVANVAWQPVTTPPPGQVPPTPLCEDAVDGRDPVTGEACDGTVGELPRLTIAKTADATTLPTDGDEVTYTVTVTNEGPGFYTDDAPATMTDSLEEVLDDAEFGEILAPAAGAEFDADAEELTWSGPLAAGASIEIRYTVVYDATAGDSVLTNTACVPEADTLPGAESCATVRIPGGRLAVSKSVDPADGSTVQSGQDVTYTLTFESTGESEVTVDKVDDLSGVLDDAEFVEGSIDVSDAAALTAVVDGDELAIDGTIPAGQTVTVSYTVTVAPYAEQGDHVLANVVQNPDGTCGPEGCPGTENPIRHFSITKTAEPVDDVTSGDVVTYTVTVTNDGAADYTTDAPASVTDDLTDVLDDAVYDGGATAVSSDGSAVPAPQYGEPVLTWSGPVAAGESVEITYTVTVTNLGDHDLVNVAAPVCAPGEDCDPPVSVEILLPSIVPAKSSDPASGESLLAGDVVDYTLSWTNDGQAAGALDSTDDLTGVLDDADITTAPQTSADGIELVFDPDAGTLRVTGELAPGETVTVTYSVTVRPDGERGDNIVGNVLVPDVPPFECADADPECDPFVPPATSHPVGELDDWKTVDPASGATVRAGQEVTYTLHFANIGEADVDVAREDVLTQVLDDATVVSPPESSDAALSVFDVADGRFLVAGTLAPGQEATVVYTVVVNDDGERGDDRLGNFLVDEGEEPPATCEPTDAERADCTVNPVSNVQVTKSADPASGTTIAYDQRVTYTLTFRNVGTNPAAAPVAVDYTDHLSGVLDDAVLSGAPAASDPSLTAAVQGQAIRITGTVATGDVVTVTYTVAPKAYDEQGDHVLANVVAQTGEEPICVPDSQLCTTHELTPPPPLAATGGEVAASLLAAMMALLIGGGIFLAVSRRRRSVDQIG